MRTGKYREENGTTRVGDALRWLVKQGKNVAPELLTIAGNITGIESLERLADSINGDTGLSDTDKQLLLAELELDKTREQEISKRWESDLKSDSWAAKNIRPYTLAFLLVCMFVFIILDSSLQAFIINPEWIDLLKTLLVTAVGGYFVIRGTEKVVNKLKE